MDNLASVQQTSCPTVLLSQRLCLSDSGFVFDPVTGKSSTVNSTGVAIIRQLRQSQNVQFAVTALQKLFNYSSTMLERDVVEFADLLRKHFT